MLDTDPDRDCIHAAAMAGTLPPTIMDKILRRLLCAGLSCDTGNAGIGRT